MKGLYMKNTKQEVWHLHDFLWFGRFTENAYPSVWQTSFWWRQILNQIRFQGKMYIYLWAEEPTTVNKAREVFSAVSTNQNEKVPFYVKSDLSLRSLMDPWSWWWLFSSEVDTCWENEVFGPDIKIILISLKLIV